MGPPRDRGLRSSEPLDGFRYIAPCLCRERVIDMVGPLREFACKLHGIGTVAPHDELCSHPEQTVAILSHKFYASRNPDVVWHEASGRNG